MALLACASTVFADAPGPKLPEMMDARTVKAIDRGLKYLARTQRSNGSWLNRGGYGTYPSVMTSLSGLAFLAGGSTPESGPYARNVTKAMHYILKIAETSGAKDGLIAGPGAEARSMYGHGFSMLFLAQCYGTELDRKTEDRIRKVLDRAVKLTAKAQSNVGADKQHAGGWIYTPSGRSDEGSVTVTQLQALRASRNAGIKVPASTIARAVLYLKYCQNADGGISYSYRSRGGSRPAISAAAIACFYAAGVYDRASGGQGEEAKMVDRLIKYVRGAVRVGGGRSFGHYFYTQFYMAQAMYQGRDRKAWREYYPQIKKNLFSLQAPDGSWQGDNVGTTYGTAIATIILQLPYNYLPIFQR